jgi:hypothetical protein
MFYPVLARFCRFFPVFPVLGKKKSLGATLKLQLAIIQKSIILNCRRSFAVAGLPVR